MRCVLPIPCYCTVIAAAAVFLLGIVGNLHAQPSGEEKLVIVCSSTQVADFARQVVGDRWEVHGILQPGVDPHIYQVKAADVELVARADLCLENGWHLEGNDWMRKLAENAGKPIVSCVEGVKPRVIEKGEEEVHDPHAWFSPLNATVYVRNIVNAVSKLDPAHESEYKSRANLYISELGALHNWIIRELNAIPANRRVLITNHDAFGYFCDVYKFKAVSPTGWSTGQEIGAGSTAERRAEVVKTIREFGVRSIFVETSVNDSMLTQIAKESGVEIGGKLYSDAMGPQGSAGETYIGMMRENVLLILEGLK